MGRQQTTDTRQVYKIKIKKGDTVVVRSGKYKGQSGQITAIHPSENKITVEGINVIKRHVKPNRAHPQGGIVKITKPILVSKVGILEPTSKKPSRIGIKKNAKGEKVRVFKKTGKVVHSPKPSGEEA